VRCSTWSTRRAPDVASRPVGTLAARTAEAGR
jgi:hypothetical protein